MEELNNIIQSLIIWLSEERKYHISVQDVSGTLHNQPLPQLSRCYEIHNCAFCNAVKTTKAGRHLCFKNKMWSIEKARNSKECFIGQCYMGITDIVQPVYQGDKLLCIIYIGHLLLDENEDKVIKRINKMSGLIGVEADLITKEMKNTERVELQTIQKYKELGYLIKHIILEEFNKNNHRINTNSIHWLVQAIQKHVDSHYSNNITLSQLAKMYYMNPQYLCHLFKKETGINFTLYVNKLRIQNAQRLLETTNEPITNIAYQVGFNNVTYFNKVFKDIVKVSPKEYRKNK